MTPYFLERESVKELIDRYFQAVYEADVTELKSIFHQNASMYGYLGEIKLIGTPEPFFDDLVSKPSMKTSETECRYVINYIEVEKNIASAVLLVDGFYGAACVKDYFHLILEKGKWMIVCKTFTIME